MGIRLKILFVFVLCFGLMAGVSLFLLKRSVDESYDAIERADLVASMGRVEQGFEASAASLRTLTTDWSVWNEMYRYALKPNPEWAAETIGKDSLAPADLTMVMIFAKDGRLLTASTIEEQGVSLASLLPQMDDYLRHIKSDMQKTRCGIVRIDAGLMLTCWGGILQGDASGEVAGAVVMGRLFDASREAKLREQTKLPFMLSTVGDLPTALKAWPVRLPSGVMGTGEFWASFDAETYRLAYPVQDILGEKVGLITLDVPRKVHQQGLLLYQQVRQQLLFTVLLMTGLLGLALHYLLIRRLRRFARQIEGLETESAWDRRIDVGGRDELGMVANNFNKLLTLVHFQVGGLRELLEAKESSLKLIQATQAKLILSEKRALQGQQRVRNLLDNSVQGFLSFGADLLVDPELSRACEQMLGSSVSGCHVADVLIGDDPAGKELFCEVVAAVLAERDSDVAESMLSLLPGELSRDGKLLKAEYKRLENSRFMVVLTDITEERRLESMVEGERRRLEFIVSAVSDRKNFFAAVDGFNEFLSKHAQPGTQKESDATEWLNSFFREVHTYKGLLNQFCFIHTPVVLHQMETRLSGLLSGDQAVTWQAAIQAVSTDELRKPFEDDMAALTDVLGREFLENKNNVVLPGALAQQLEELATRLLHGETIDAADIETRNLLKDVLVLRKVTFKEILLSFNGLVKQVGKAIGKEVAPIEVRGGDDFWVDPKPYQGFIQALGHVFRNAVTHGLETPEARWEAEKDEVGCIACEVSLASSAIRLTIADDGAGIDLSAIRQRAVTTGIAAAEEVSRMSDEDVIALVFRDGMSTRNAANRFSGRGVGLAAVLSETRKLGGDVVIRTVAGKGTQFLFTLPLRHVIFGSLCAPETSSELSEDEVALVMHSIVANTREYFEGEHGVTLRDDAVADDEASQPLLSSTVMIALQGRIDMPVAFSVQDGLADAVYGWMTDGFGELAGDVQEHRNAAVAELLNTVLGQCTIDLQHLDRQGIGLTPPVVLDGAATLPANTFVRCRRGFVTEYGRLNIMLIEPLES